MYSSPRRISTWLAAVAVVACGGSGGGGGGGKGGGPTVGTRWVGGVQPCPSRRFGQSQRTIASKSWVQRISWRG